MKSSLWTQSIKITEEDTFVFDGTRKVLYSSQEEENHAMRLFSDARKWPLYKAKEINNKKKDGKLRQTLFISKNKKGFFITSCYTDRDEKNRYVSFLFYCESKTLSEALEELKVASATANRTCDENELNTLRIIEEEEENTNIFSGFSNLKIILLLLLLTTTFTLVFSLLR